MAGLTTLSADTSIESAVEVIERDGGVIIKDLFQGAPFERLQQHCLEALERVAFGADDSFAGTRTRRAGARTLLGTDNEVCEVILNPLFNGVARRILQQRTQVWFGSERTDVTPDLMIGSMQVIEITPGQGAQPLHRDDTAFLWRHPDYGREARVQIMVAISDFTAENGGTLVIPTSNRWDDERMPTLEEAVPTEMTVGSALIWVGSTYHAGGQNTGDDNRIGLTVTLDMASVRQEENQFLSIPLERVRQLPEEVQQLLGWRAGKNFMGFVEVDGQFTDPGLLLSHKDYTVVGELPSKI
jgi:hypothetical protein